MKRKTIYPLCMLLILSTLVAALSSCSDNGTAAVTDTTAKTKEIPVTGEADESLDPELLVDICMENIHMWTEDEDTYFEYQDSLFYSYLDLDFDGVPEFIASANQYELRDPENRFFKIDPENRTLAELPGEAFPCDIGDPDQGKTRLLRNKETGELCYWCEDFYAYMTGGTGSKFKTMYCNGDQLQERLMFEEYVDDVSMHKSASRYTVYSDDGTGSEVGKEEYDAQKEQFLNAHEDLDLKFESAIGPGFWHLKKSDQKQALLGALLSYSYDGFEISLSEDTEDNEDTKLFAAESYEWIIEPSQEYGNISVIRDAVGGSAAISVAVSEKNGVYSLIGYDGQIKLTDYNTEYKFCPVTRTLTNYNGVIDSVDYSSSKFTSGFCMNSYSPYIYDLKDGQVYDGYGTEYRSLFPGNADIIVEGIKNVNEYGYGNYETKGKYGLYRSSEIIVPFEYENWLANDMQYKILALAKDDIWTYFDRYGNEIISGVSAITDETDATPYQASFDRICIRKNGKWGYVDLRGNTVIEPTFEDALPVYCGMAWVKTEKGWGVIRLDDYKAMSAEEAEKTLCENLSYDTYDCECAGSFYSGYGYVFKVVAINEFNEEKIYRYIVDEYSNVYVSEY